MIGAAFGVSSVLARATFTTGLNTVAAVGTIIFAALAVATIAVLRRHDTAA
ncbi:hypothetical protein [Nonomuraea sp. 10N515B]|uniref:hypothetical protein n=1 Tax=Nonomuraea sp. 10N515B TaxID=3457422 RepID=UPI003FCD494A